MSQYQTFQTGHFSQQSIKQPTFESYKESLSQNSDAVPRFGGETNNNYSQNTYNADINLQNYDSIKRDQTGEQSNYQREMRQESTVEVLKKAEDIIRNSQFIGGAPIKTDYQQKLVQPFSSSSTYQPGQQSSQQDNPYINGIGKVDILKRADDIIRNSQLSQIENQNKNSISPSPSAGLFSQNTLHKEKSVDDIIAEIKSRSSQVGGSTHNYQVGSGVNVAQNYGGYSSRDASPIVGQLQSAGGITRQPGVTSSYVSIGKDLTPIGNNGYTGSYSPSQNVNDILNRYKKGQTFTSQYSENISLAQEFPQAGGNQQQQKTFLEDDTMKNNYNENSAFDIKQYSSNPSHGIGDAHQNLPGKILPNGFTPKQSSQTTQQPQFSSNYQQVTANNYSGNNIKDYSQNKEDNLNGSQIGYNHNKSLSHQNSIGFQNDMQYNQNNHHQSSSEIPSSNPVIEELIRKYSQKSLTSSFVQANNPSTFQRQASLNHDSLKEVARLQSNSPKQNNYTSQKNDQIYSESTKPYQQYNSIENQNDQYEKVKKSSTKNPSNNQYSASKQEKVQQEYSGSNDKVKVQVYKEMLQRKKKDRIYHNATKIICYHIWNYVKRMRNKKNRDVLVQFVHHCASIVQKYIRGRKIRKIINLPHLRNLAQEIQALTVEQQLFNDDMGNEEISQHLYEQKKEYSDQIEFIKNGGNWAKRYQDRLKKNKQSTQQQPQKQQNDQRQSRKEQYSQEVERKLPSQRSNQKLPTEESRERKESKTVRVKTETEVDRHNQWDDIPVGGKSKKKNENLMTWDNAYPPDSQLDNNQVEFLQDQKKRSNKPNKNYDSKNQDDHEETLVAHSERKNQWDEIPIGQHKKKAMEQEWEEFPTDQNNPKPVHKPAKKVIKQAEKNEEGETITDGGQKPQTKKNVKKTKEQLDNLKKRTKYDPRKAIEQAKQKQEADPQNSPQKQNTEDANEQDQEKLNQNDQLQEQPIKKKVLSKKPIKKPTQNTQQTNQDEDDDFNVPNEDESQGQNNQQDPFQIPKKQSPRKNNAVKKPAQQKPVPQNNNNNNNNNLDQVFNVEELDQNDDKSKKEFLKRKPKEIKFQKLNWNNVKSRTDTGRQELESREQYKKQQKVAQQQLQERNNQMKKNAKSQQNQVLPYYSELNYIDEDEAFNEPVRKNNLNISNQRNPNQYFDHNNQKQVTQQQYPVAPKVFTEYLPNKVSQKAIHQASPTQPSQEIIIRPQMFQNKNQNDNNNYENQFYQEDNQGMQQNDQQMMEYQQKLQSQQNSNKYKNAVSDLERMRQNKRESVLQQQQQQQQIPQQQQQFMQDYQRLSNQQYTEEQLREIQMRQFQQSQSQHKQIFQFPQNFFKGGDSRVNHQNNQAMRYEDYIQSQQNQQNNKSIQEIMLKKQQQFMKLDEFS